MDVLVQQIIGGLAIGCVYSLIALGFSMMLRATELINFAQGEMVMLGTFLGWTLLRYTALPYWAVFLVTAALTGLFGLAVERVVIRRILRQRSPLLNMIIATLGLLFIMRSAAILVWGPDPLTYASVLPQEPLTLAGLRVNRQYLWILTLGAGSMLALHLFFQRTMTGIAWRAVAADGETAAIMGVSTRRTIALTWAISSALGGAAGVLIGPLFYASVAAGWLAIKAFGAAAIGGFGIAGSMAGGLALGVLETVVAGHVSSEYKDVITYAVMILVLLFFYRPRMPVGRGAGERTRAVAVRDILPLGRRFFPRWLPLAVGAAAWLALPLAGGDDYTLHVLDLAMIHIVAALGLQVIIGFTGQLSLAHAAFYGIGAYTSALLTLALGVPFWLAFLAAPMMAGLLGWAVSPILRLSGHFLAIATVALGEIVYFLNVNSKELTRGTYGIYNIPPPRLGPLLVSDKLRFYYLISAVLFVQLFVLYRVARSRFGRALLAVRENELGALGAGIHAARYKMKAFVLGTAWAGLAGALYAHFINYISPDSFTLLDSIDMLIMVVVGGLGSLPGAVVGAVAVTLMPEYLRFFSDYRLIIYGGILIVFMMFLPAGLAGLLKAALEAVASRLGRRMPAVAPPATEVEGE